MPEEVSGATVPRHDQHICCSVPAEPLLQTRRNFRAVSGGLESLARQFPTSPFVVDTTKAADQFGLRSANFGDLLNNIVPGSGLAP